MKGIKLILCGIAVILVGVGFSCSGKFDLGGFEMLLFVFGLGMSFYGLKKE